MNRARIHYTSWTFRQFSVKGLSWSNIFLHFSQPVKEIGQSPFVYRNKSYCGFTTLIGLLTPNENLQKKERSLV